jgi:hypothetical protein
LKARNAGYLPENPVVNVEGLCQEHRIHSHALFCGDLNDFKLHHSSKFMAAVRLLLVWDIMDG